MSPASHAPLFVREMGLPVRFGLYVLACLFLLALDARYSALSGVRAGLNAALHPLQMGLAAAALATQKIIFERHVSAANLGDSAQGRLG